MSDIKNRNQIDDSMQLGYTFEMKNDYVGACTEWGKTWKYIVSAMDTGHYNSIEDFDEDFDGTQCVFNWASDYEMELNNAMMDDRSFAQIRIDYCTEYLKRVSKKDGLNCINIRRAIAETYYQAILSNLFNGFKKQFGWKDACYSYFKCEIVLCIYQLITTT